MAISTGSLSIYSPLFVSSGSTLTFNSVGRSVNSGCRPNSDLFFVYTWTISILYCDSGTNLLLKTAKTEDKMVYTEHKHILTIACRFLRLLTKWEIVNVAPTGRLPSRCNQMSDDSRGTPRVDTHLLLTRIPVLLLGQAPSSLLGGVASRSRKTEHAQ